MTMKTISLINMKGGVCKTTLAVNIAQCLVRRNFCNVLLVDIDPQFNATQCLMTGKEYVKHLGDGADTILSVFDRHPRVLPSATGAPKEIAPKKPSEIDVISINDEIDLLPGNLELYRLEMAPGGGNENRLKHFLKAKREDYDYVIIDTPPTPSVWMTSALIASDYYLIPVRSDPISMTGIDLLRNIVDEKKENFDLKLSCVGLVLTVVESNTRVYRNARMILGQHDYWSKHLYPMVLPKRVQVATDQLNQIHILDGIDFVSKKAITDITTELVSRINADGK